MTEAAANPIVVETINGKEYFHRKDDFHELIFWDWYASKFYSHLAPNPYHEDWELEENDELPKDMESLFLPLLLDDNGDEFEVEQVAQLYKIKLTHIMNSSRHIDGCEEESWDWKDGVREDSPTND